MVVFGVPSCCVHSFHAVPLLLLLLAAVFTVGHSVVLRASRGVYGGECLLAFYVNLDVFVLG